jgi:hypothetical protein
VVGLFALIGCKPAPLPGEPNAAASVGAVVGEEEQALDDPVLVRVGDREITISEFERRRAMLSGPAERRYAALGQSSALLESMVLVEVLGSHAERLGLAGGATEALLVAEARARAVVEEAATRTVNPVELEDQLRAWFEAERSRYERPEQRRVYGIVLDDAETAARVRAEVEAALAVTRPPHVFERLAEHYSVHEPSRLDGGRYGEIVSIADGGAHDPALDEAVFAAEANTLLPVLRTTRGWEVVYVGGVTPARILSFDDARPVFAAELLDRALGEAMRRRFDAARIEAGVEVDTAAVHQLASARADEPPEPVRARRFAQATLEHRPVAELGETVLAGLNATSALAVQNPNTAPAPSEGSGDAETP